MWRSFRCGFRSRNVQCRTHTKSDIHYCNGLMPAISGLVGRVGPRHKRRNSFGNDSKNQLAEKVAPFNSETEDLDHLQLELNINKSQNSRCLSHIPLTFFLYYSWKILFIQNNVLPNRAYLYVCVYYDIPNDNNSKFPKSPNPHP